MSKDLVCGAEVDSESDRYFSDYGNDQYFFCSPECKRKFDDHPDHYIREHARRDLGIG